MSIWIVASVIAVLILVLVLSVYNKTFAGWMKWLFNKALLGLIWIGLSLVITALGVFVLALMFIFAVPAVLGKLLWKIGTAALKSLEKLFKTNHDKLIGLGFKAAKKL